MNAMTEKKVLLEVADLKVYLTFKMENNGFGSHQRH